jgi:hypothetical protein
MGLSLHSAVQHARPWAAPHGTVEVTGLTTTRTEADRLLDEHLAAINEGVGLPYTHDRNRKSWLAHALDPAPGLAGVNLEYAVFKLKDALLCKRYSDRQIEVAYHHLTRTDHNVGLTWGMATYGGKVNTMAPDATACAQRDSILTTSVTAGWEDPQDEDITLAWVRRFYRDLFADTGGVPIPAEVSSGASINHPDIDLADPEWNTSGVPWHTMYYRGNYPDSSRPKPAGIPSILSTTPCLYASLDSNSHPLTIDRLDGLHGRAITGPLSGHKREHIRRPDPLGTLPHDGKEDLQVIGHRQQGVRSAPPGQELQILIEQRNAEADLRVAGRSDGANQTRADGGHTGAFLSSWTAAFSPAECPRRSPAYQAIEGVAPGDARRRYPLNGRLTERDGMWQPAVFGLSSSSSSRDSAPSKGRTSGRGMRPRRIQRAG